MTEAEYRDAVNTLDIVAHHELTFFGMDPLTASDWYTEVEEYLNRIYEEVIEYDALRPISEEVAAYDEYMQDLACEEADDQYEWERAEAFDQYLQEELDWYNHAREMGWE